MSAGDVGRLVEDLRGMLPQPVQPELGGDGAVWLTGGEPGEVVARVTTRTVSIAIFGVRWAGPHEPRPAPRWLARFHWHNLESGELYALLVRLIESAAARRCATYRTCRYCGKNTPPEWQHGDDVCQSCAERHLGVVH